MREIIEVFGGIAPKMAPENLPSKNAQTAENARLHTGKLEPWYNSVLSSALRSTSAPQTIYLYEDTYWLEWGADVDVVLALVSNDTTGKFYYTGDGIPKKSYEAIAITGSDPYPASFYPLGLPVPHAKLTAANAGGGTGDDRLIQYVWTVVSTWGEESAPSPPLDSVLTQKDGDTVNLSEITMEWKAGESYAVDDSVYKVGDEGGTYLFKCVVAGTSGAVEPTWDETVDEDTTDNTATWRCFPNNLAQKYIYRFQTGDATAGYKFVAAIAIGTTTYADSKLDVELAEDLSAVDLTPPPDSLANLFYMGNGIVGGFTGKDLYFSPAYKPYTYPEDYRQSLPFTIIAVIAIGDTAVVLTDGGPYYATGNDPSAISIVPLPSSSACVSKTGAKRWGTTVLYPAPDGLYAVTRNGVENITKGHYDYKGWQELYPATFKAVIWDNKYIAWYDFGDNEGAICLDLISGELTTFDFLSYASHVHEKTGTLYFVRPDILLDEAGQPILDEEGHTILDE